jgi:iron complex outermembrane receptor protein
MTTASRYLYSFFLSAMTTAAVAQTEGGPAGSGAAPAEPLQEVVVTGLRHSIQQSLDIKRDSINVVDSIATEDLGKLPDQNVAESLQRITGVTIDRNRGDGQFVSVRGLGPQFNIVTLNGRTLATENVGREFSFDVLPSELIAGADVFKSPTARLNGASIGATVDVRTLRPLNLAPFVVAGTAEAKREELNDSWGPSISGVTSWHDMYDTFGVSVVGSYEHRKVRTDEFDIGAGWVKHSNTDSYYAGRVGPDVAPFTNTSMPSNMSPSFIFADKKRYGADATVQFKPRDNLVMTLDGFYTKLDELDSQADIAYDFSGGTLVDQVLENNTAVYQKFQGGTVDEIIVRAPRRSQTYLLGYNIDWKPGNFDLAADASYSQATRKGADDTYFSTIRRTGSTLAWDSRAGNHIFDMAFSNPNYPNAPTDLAHIGGHYEADGGSDYKDQTLELRLDGAWDPGTGVKAYAGVGREIRKKTIDSISMSPASQCAFCGGMVYTPLPASLFSVTPGNWFSSYGGNTLRQWVTYDPRQLVAALQSYTAAHPGFVGYQPPTFNPAQSSEVEERVNIAYLMFDFKAQLGSLPFTVNTGVRMEDTHFGSNGAAQTILSAAPNGGGQNIITLSPVVPIGFVGHYTDILPSMNVRLDITDTLLARFAASRVMTRPTLEDLSPAQTILTNPGNEQITHGNPDLKPFRASQAEVGLEWYVDRLTLLSAAVFYKSIDSFVAEQTTPQLVDQVTFQVTEPTNGKGATVKGAEIGYRQVFSWLPGPFDGFGLQGSYTYVESDASYANAVSGTNYGLEGLSKSSYSTVGFYEKYGLQARLAWTWRDKFLKLANGRNGLPLYFASYGQLDASLSYDVTKSFSVTANALNLTNAKEFTYSVTPNQVFSYGTTGRRYALGVRARF